MILYKFARIMKGKILILLCIESKFSLHTKLQLQYVAFELLN